MKLRYKKTSVCFSTVIVIMLFSLYGSVISQAQVAESAWINLDQEWAAYAADHDYAKGGWSSIHGIEFDIAEDARRLGALTVVRSLDSGAVQATESAFAGSVLRRVLIDFRRDEYSLRVVLEGARVVAHSLNMPRAGALTGVIERLTLEFEAVTYIYVNPDLDEEGAAVFSEYDYIADQGRAGEFAPRADDDPPESVLVSRLDRSLVATGRMRISWASIPGVGYVVEFTPSLDQEFRPIAEIDARIGDEGRYAEIFFDGTNGFYRVRER